MTLHRVGGRDADSPDGWPRRLLEDRLSALLADREVVTWRLDLATEQLQWDEGAAVTLELDCPRMPATIAQLLEWTPEHQHAAVRDGVERMRRSGTGRVDLQLPGRLYDRYFVFSGHGLADGREAVGVLQDVTAQVGMEQQVLAMATVDPVTGFGNRYGLERALEEALHDCREQAGSVTVALVALDSYDVLSAEAGSIIAGQARVAIGHALAEGESGAQIYALERGRFGLLRRGVDATTSKAVVVDRLANLGAVRLHQLPSRSFSARAGTASFRGGDASVSSAALLFRAERALHSSSTEGGDPCCAYEDQLEHLDGMEHTVRQALADDEFVLHYQPLVDLDDDRVVSAEALARWQTPEGFVPPSRFIPAVEASELACEFGRWVLFEATRQAVAWDAAPETAGLSVNVNVAVRHAARASLYDDITGALAASGLAPERLEIELTETGLQRSDIDYELLRRIRGLGVRVAIDDFGTGLTSISELGVVPADTIKIDRAFIENDDPRQRRLGELMIDAARFHELEVVAEGIETAGTKDRVTGQGCHVGQGFLIAKPMDPANFADFAVGFATERPRG